MTSPQTARAAIDARACTIVADQSFILATRDTGYRDLSAAVAELIDNSLQAGARHVNVFVREEHEGVGRTVTIAVLDDGHGMSAETLQVALQFGGSERFGDRSGLGRFGMGLPNSSVSQTRRFEVYSWQSPGIALHTYLDIDEVVAGHLRVIPTPSPRLLPEWVRPHAQSSGTLVLWTRCDRLGRSRASTVAERLGASLGRLYRYALWDGVRISINELKVAAIDPLFHNLRARLHGAVLYGPPLLYEFAAPNGGSSTIEIRFAELPVAEWHAWSADDKRRAGIVGAAGVSIVRAGREIDYGWYLMGSKRRENYDDWWRCEVRFPPQLDELFGVTHSKQGISPAVELRATVGPDLEAIARALNARVRSAFQYLKVAAESPAVHTASASDQFLPPPRLRRRRVGAGGFDYRIDTAILGGPEFYRVRLAGSTVVLTLNREHPFFTHLYEPACGERAERERYHIECLLLSAARAELEAGDKQRELVGRLRRAWADALATFLDP